MGKLPNDVKGFVAATFSTVYSYSVPKIKPSTKLSDREVAICRRLKEAREGLGFSQRAFADKLQITRERLASYETLRAPVKFGFGMMVCLTFEISEMWLATGKGEMRGLSNYPLDYSLMPDQNADFGWAYDKVLRLPIELRGGTEKKPITPGDVKRAKELLRSALQFWEQTVKDEDWEDFSSYLWSIGEQLRRNKWRVLLDKRGIPLERVDPKFPVPVDETL